MNGIKTSPYLLLVILFFPAFALCGTHFFSYRNGMTYLNGSLQPKTLGLITFEDRSFGHVTVKGTFWKGALYNDFALGLQIGAGKWVNGTYQAKAICMEVAWNNKYMAKLDGTIHARGTWDSMNFTGYCHSESQATNVTVNIVAKKANCSYFPPVEGAQNAQALLGGWNLTAGSVLGYAVYGQIYNHYTCSYFSRAYNPAEAAKPGLLIVGTNATHCAVIDKEGDKFVHLSPVTKKVVLTPMSMIKQHFKDGYTIRDYSC